ncbi:MAG: hypothetical protein LBR30_04170 [Clostridioides sp.]|jgi:hypothetical protein|nr:hypothetical protein [Clostridioides sp.]
MNEKEAECQGFKEAEWSRFCGRLLSYINDYYSIFVKTDYEIELEMALGEILEELQNSRSVEDLSPQLRKIAKQYEKSTD